MNEKDIYNICKALVSICERECCDYGFTEYVDKAEEFINTTECKIDKKGDNMEYSKLKEALYIYKDTDSTKLDEELLNELTTLAYTIGQGDCYGCYCQKYCCADLTCFNAIKKSIIEIIEKGLSYEDR